MRRTTILFLLLFVMACFSASFSFAQDAPRDPRLGFAKRKAAENGWTSSISKAHPPKSAFRTATCWRRRLRTR